MSQLGVIQFENGVISGKESTWSPSFENEIKGGKELTWSPSFENGVKMRRIQPRVLDLKMELIE